MARSKPDPAPRGAKLRCAVYTRKSSEEGLDQEFNSLDAQREACLAFIASQRHEGWTALPNMYADGGFSGGTMERPALQRLLEEVRAGRVDVIVVYKVDRLTRALADFAKIVEILDARRASFVSVTQAFNTTTSMGRLTLNVLLSFAQFEREVTGERIRDKIAASKRKGMWMGGQPPLGYDVRDRRLVVNEGEAATVRRIFRRYRDLRSVRQLKLELDGEGVVSKARRFADGSPYGAQPFSRGALYAMLQNRLYGGEVTHKGASYPGEQPAIVDAGLWTEVQEILGGNRVDRDVHPDRDRSLLTGLVYDPAGERLTPTHATKRGTRYRYYVSRSILDGSARDGEGRRIPAASLEGLVRARLGKLLVDPSVILAALNLDAARHRRLLAFATALAAGWTDADGATLCSFIRAALTRVGVYPDRIELTVSPRGIVDHLEGDDRDGRSEQPTPDADAPDITLTIPARLKRVGVEFRFILDGDEGRVADPALTRLLIQAHGIRDRAIADSTWTIEDLARQEGVGTSYAARLIRLAFLAPDIVEHILAGRQPPELTARTLMSDTRLPLGWAEQRKALGFAPR